MNENLQFRNESWDGKDLLGRKIFAEQLAQRIKIWKNKSSLVIGLYGEWGNGKSVAKDMVLQTLRDDKTGCPLITEFNPWEWSGHEEMTAALFSQIRATLGKKDNDKFAKKAAKLLKKYELSLKATIFSLEGLGKLLVFLSLFPLAFGSATGSTISQLIGLVSVFLGLLLQLTKYLKEFFEQWGAVFSYGEEKTLRELKDEATEALTNLKKPLLVVVDDVDRLSAEEIRNLFQLVKANLDFPNIIYFLIFQKDIIADALEKMFKVGSGNEYLKKIIQVGFDLPRIERCRLEEVLRKELEKLISQHGLQVSGTRIDEAFKAGFGKMFKNLRDIYRFVDAMDFHLGLLKQSGSLEVDLVDLAILETFRQSETEVYGQIPRFRMELLRRAEGMAAFLKKDEEKDAEYKKAIKQLLEKTSDQNKDAVQDLLKMLFPPSYSAIGENENTWLREFRICDSDGFDRYFLLSVPMGAMSKSEVDKIMSAVGDVEKLCAILAEFHRENRLYDALRYLGANEPSIDSKHGVSLITALFNVGDWLESRMDEDGWILRTTSDISKGIIFRFLKREPDENKRVTWLSEAIQKTTGVFLPARIISLEAEYKERNPQHSVLPENAWRDLQKACAEKIRTWAKNNESRKHPRLVDILIFWKNWGTPEEVSKWINEFISTKEGLLSFLRLFLSFQGTNKEFFDDEHLKNAMNLIEWLIPPDQISAKISSFEIKTDDDLVVERFQKGLQMKSKQQSSTGIE